ncbi:MAG: DUF167 domain-containing protein [Acidobacteriaceae bacterium]
MSAESAVHVRDTPQGAVFEVRVHPRAKRTAIVGILDGRLKIALASPPVDGRANEELQRFFSKLFNAPRSAVVLLAGEHARNKRVLIAERNSAAILAAIELAHASKDAHSS